MTCETPFCAVSPGGPIDVHVIDKSSEAYVPPPVTVRPFQGEGRSMLDDTAPADHGAVVSVEPKEAVVDDSAPTTSIQVRMADGSRRVIKLNLTHSVASLRAHVATLLGAGARFEMTTQFPRAKVTDDDKTVKEAGLANNTIAVTLLSS